MGEQAVAVREIMSTRTQEPEVEVAKGKRKADALMKIVRSTHLLSSKIGEKEYLRVEAWETIARFEGLLPNIVWTRKIEEGGEHVGYEARAEWVTIEGQALGVGAESECRFEEQNWNLDDKSKNAVKSMAQTRAVAKLGRQCFAWIAVLAGFSPTPAEEMEQTGGGKPAPPPTCPQCGNAKSVIMGKAEYGGGWVCWKKRGGCGHQWGAESPKDGQRVEDLPPTTKGGDAPESPLPEMRSTPPRERPLPEGVSIAPPPSSEGGGAQATPSRPDAARAESAEDKRLWVARLLEQMDRTGKTEGDIRTHLYNEKNPGLMLLPPAPRKFHDWNMKVLVPVVQWLSTLEAP